MKRLYSILFFFLVLYFNGNSQNYLSYYKYINKAEIAICDSIYEQAIEYYDSAFNITKTPYLKDLKNANLCAIYLNNYEKCYVYIQKMISKRYPLDYLESKDYDALKKTNYWNKLKNTDSLRNKETNESVIKQLKKRYQKEQNLAYQKNIDSIHYKRYINCVIDNYNNIKEFASKFGFPDEELNDHEFCNNTSYVFFTLLHYYQLIQIQSKLPNEKLKNLEFLLEYNFDYNEIHNLLYDAVLKGKFLPSTFANLEDIINPRNYGTLNFIQVNDTCGFIKYTEPELINNNRLKIGLCSLNNAKTILNYKINLNKGCPYPPNDKESNVCTYDKKEYEEFDLRSGKYQVFYFNEHKEGREFFNSMVNQ